MPDESSSITGRTVLQIAGVAIGLACMLRMLMRSYRLFGVVYPNEIVLITRAVFAVVLLVASLVLILFRERIDSLFLDFRFAAPACMGMCALLYWILLAVGSLTQFNAQLGVLFISLYASLLAGCVCAWGCLLFKLRDDVALIGASIAPVIASLFELIAGVGHVKTAILTGVVAVIMPACSLVVSNRGPAKKPRYELESLRSLPLLALVVFLSGLVADSVASGVLALDSFDRTSVLDSVIVFATALIVGALLAAAAALDASRRRVSMVFLLVCTLLVVTVLFLAIGFSIYESSSRLPLKLLDTARVFCMIGCLVIVIEAMQKRVLSPTMLFGLFTVVAVVAPLMIRGFVAPAVNSATNDMLLQNQEIAILVVSAGLIFVTFILLVPMHMVVDEEGRDGGGEPDLATAYSTIAHAYGLTAREQEVMQLIAEGNSMRKVGELLFISLGTVQSHAKNIYKKLDVHSRQELADLIERHRA